MITKVKLLLVAALPSLVALALVPHDTTQLRNTLMQLMPITLLLTLVLFVFFLFRASSELRSFLPKNKQIYVALIFILLIGLYLRGVAAPHTHRLYYDEDIYLNIGQNILEQGKAWFCNRGTPECAEGEYNKQPQGWPVLLSVAFATFGVDEAVGRSLNIFLSTASIALVFLIGRNFFGDIPGIMAALVFALIPQNASWAPTMAAETSGVFFALSAICILSAYTKTREKPLLLAGITGLAFAVQIRPEAALLLPITGILLWNNLEKERMLPLLLLGFLLAPHALHMYASSSDSWGAAGNKFDYSIIQPNLAVNGPFYYENVRFPALFTLLAIVGIAVAAEARRVLIPWFFFFFVMYLPFYAGSYNYGVDVRFSLNTYVPIALLAGTGAAVVIRRVQKLLPRHATLAMSLLLIAAFMPFLSQVEAVGEQAWDARAPHDFILEEMKSRSHCVVFTQVPTAPLVSGYSALQTWFLQNSYIRNQVFAQYSCVLFLEDYWCGAPQTKHLCEYAHQNFKLTPLNSTTVRTRTFTLYQLEPLDL